MKTKHSLLTALVLSIATLAGAAEAGSLPHLEKKGTATQLVVDGQPFLMLGGELHNSSSSSLAYMKPIWPVLQSMHLNAVLAPVSWELIEPREGQFDFSVVDGLIQGARSHDLHLVLLWFGTWKNSMSCYVPEWVKTDSRRFPRAEDRNGVPQEILSPFSAENLRADARAFAALMVHVRKVDGNEHTVIMVQVENEIGMIPDARDHSATANDHYRGPVPEALMDYLAAHESTLNPGLREAWDRAGHKKSGTWEDVFGASIRSEEIFMAWYYARYTDAVAAAGKAEYPIPMYVNTALSRPNTLPGQYPSAGPLPHLMDVWRAGAPSIDWLSPDIYFPNFAEWCDKYHRAGNPLFIPEMRPVVANLFYALGQYDAMGVSPFGIEDCGGAAQPGEPASVGQSYRVLSELSPMILAHQGSGSTVGVWLDDEHRTQTVKLGNYTFTFAHEYTWPYSAGFNKPAPWPRVGGLMIMLSPDEFVLAGTGLVVTFKSDLPGKPSAGIVRIDEGSFENGKWTPRRRLNGDEDHQGRHLLLPSGQAGIQWLKLYSY